MGLEAKGDEGISTVTRARRAEQMATKKGDTVDLKGGTGKTSGVRTQVKTTAENSLIWGRSRNLWAVGLGMGLPQGEAKERNVRMRHPQILKTNLEKQVLQSSKVPFS